VQQTEQDVALADRGKHRAAVQNATCIWIDLYGGDPAQARYGAFGHRLSDEDTWTRSTGHYATQPWSNPLALTTPA
jgi:hypothetical protein